MNGLRSLAVIACLATASSLFAGFSQSQDFRPATPAELAMKSAPSAPGAPAAILDWVRVDDHFTATSSDYYRIKVFNEEGKKHANIEVPYLPGYPASERVTDISARTIQPDGRVVPFDGQVYDKVAFEVEQRQSPYEDRLLWRFQGTLPVLRSSFTIRTSIPYETKWVRWTPPADAAGPTWELRDIPAIEDEPRSPEARALAGWMGISWDRRRTWGDVASWFATLASTRLASTPELAAKSKELGDLRACARFTQLDVRYVAVEIGIGGYQPHQAADVFRNRFGDCKDKATLLRAMLKERGTESHYVLVHTTRGVTEPSFPTIAAFNHVIVAVREEGKLVFFDPTNTTTPYGLLPPYLQGNRALLVTDHGGELIALPLHAPEASELRRVARLRLEENGVLRGTVEETRTGSVAAGMRDSLQPLNAADRVRFVERSLANHLGHHTTSDVTIEQLDDPAVPLVIRYSIVANDYATRVADMLLVRPRVIGAKGEGAIDTARKYPYVTEGTTLHTDDVEIAMPAAAALDELPKPVELKTPHVQYTSASSFENGVLRYRRRYMMNVQEVPAGEVGGAERAFAKIAADERASAVFK